MTELNPPWALQNLATHTAAVNKMLMNAINGGGEGVLPSSGLGNMSVAQRGAGANMSVDIAAGVCTVFGDENSTQGVYGCVNDATVNRTIAAADPTNPRRDLVGVRVRDSFYSGATNAWDLFVVTGTPAASPADPAVPNNFVTLARVAVAAAASSITNANITDLRPFIQLGIVPVNSARPPGTLYGPYSQEPVFKTLPTAGQPIFEVDTYSLKQYTTGTTGFRPPWNLPWGLITSSQKTGADQTIGAVPTDVTGLTVTWTAVANRKYRVKVLISWADSSGTTYSFIICDAANTPVRSFSQTGGAGFAETTFFEHVESPAAGSVTRKFRQTAGITSIMRASGTTPTQYCEMFVYDDGPAANPA